MYGRKGTGIVSGVSSDILRPRLGGFGDPGVPMAAEDGDAWSVDDALLDGDTDEPEDDLGVDTTEDEAPLIDLDGLTPAERKFLDDYYSSVHEEQFAKDKAALQSSYDRQLDETERENTALLEANASLQTYAQALRRFAMDLAKEMKQEGRFHVFDGEAKEAISKAQQEQRRTQAGNADWYNAETEAISAYIEEQGTSREGVQLFDWAKDKEINAARVQYLREAQAASKANFQNRAKNQRWQQAKKTLVDLLAERREDGIARGANRGRGASRTRQARETGRSRGTQSRGSSTAGGGGGGGRSRSGERSADQLRAEANKQFQQRYGRAPSNADYAVVHDIMTTLEYS